MIYVLIVSIITVILASIFAIRPTAKERLTAYIRSQAMMEGWKVRFVTEEDLNNIYRYPLSEPVVCYFKYHDEGIRQALSESWGVSNNTVEGVLGKKYLQLNKQDGSAENNEIKTRQQNIIDGLFQNYGETIYGIEFDQSGLFLYWNEKIKKTETDSFLNIISQFLD